MIYFHSQQKMFFIQKKKKMFLIYIKIILFNIQYENRKLSLFLIITATLNILYVY